MQFVVKMQLDDEECTTFLESANSVVAIDDFQMLTLSLQKVSDENYPPILTVRDFIKPCI